jgi:hypothetical protein
MNTGAMITIFIYLIGFLIWCLILFVGWFIGMFIFDALIYGLVFATGCVLWVWKTYWKITTGRLYEITTIVQGCDEAGLIVDLPEFDKQHQHFWAGNEDNAISVAEELALKRSAELGGRTVYWRSDDLDTPNGSCVSDGWKLALFQPGHR